MNRLLALLHEKQTLTAESKAIFAAAEADNNRDLTPAEATRDDEIEARLTAIEGEMAREERRRAREVSTEAESANPRTAPVVTMGTDHDREKPFKSFAEQLIAIRAMGLGEASEDQRAKLRYVAAAAGAGEALDSDGGFLVQTDYASGILKRMYTLGQVLSRVKMTPVSGNALEIPAIDESSRATGSRLGGIQAYWVDEGTAPTQVHPKIYKIALKLKKLAALGYSSDELLADAPAFSDLYTQGFADELTFMTEDAIINGIGGGQPLGILNSAALVSVAEESGQTATTLKMENIANMRSRLWARSRPNAVWLYNQDIEPQLLTLTLSSGNVSIPVYLPAGGVSGQPYDTLYGMPLIPVEYCATLGTQGDIILADLSQYVMISKGGIEQAQSIHVRFTTDEMTFRATYRVDGQPAWRTTLTPKNGSNTQSPFVVVATRS